MTKVYVDVSMIMIGTNFTGIPRVVMEVTKRLVQYKELVLVFLEYNQKRDQFEIIDTKGFVEFCNTKTEKRNHLRTGQFLNYDEMEEQSVFFDMDTVWKTRVKRSFLYPVLKNKNVRIVPFIQDIIGITHPQFCPLSDMLCFVDFIGASFAYADEIVITSEATRKAIEDVCKNLKICVPKTKIVPLGSNYADRKKDIENDEKDKSMDVRDEIKQIASNDKYLLMVGTIDPRKNHKLLLDAYEQGLKELGFSIVIAGFKGWNNDLFINRMENHPDYGKGVYHINGASDEEISFLYEHSFALAFPSYIEGYGLPIMESLQRKTMVLAADTPINMETGGEFALYFREDHPEELVRLVKQLSEDDNFYQDIYQKIEGYVPPTWEDCSQRIYELLV